MKSGGTSVPEVVRELITRNRSIFDCMKMDVVNYTALAVKLQPEVEKHLRGPVNLNTIVVAIKRYADSFEEKEEVREESVLKNARLSLTDGILDIKLSTQNMEDPFDLLTKFSKVTNDYEFFRLADSFRFLTEDVDDIRKLFSAFPNVENLVSSGLAKIKITIPPEQNRSDVVSYVAEKLHTSGIELVNAYFSQDNIVIVLNEKDASRAYEILRSEIVRPSV
ncbi:MAG: ACT domain-containing protein [Nitrosopumilaceae archaeon]|nr:ACT domain-containing protein [Nitrosopumilaceae archaeon]NIU00897.1 ACT domain-containing protein [Nitrosopumilaceae archaeon]NIU87350.1 ACT domain-containing protein [Nitrosopumilaceae archaeon]NIV65878.1 ACT domain-containing protein [Nitrosopumilaceae archaeon]NIX61499.1 ACT domain-containing protein [Nitrosopumilaceae archaeon]